QAQPAQRHENRANALHHGQEKAGPANPFESRNALRGLGFRSMGFLCPAGGIEGLVHYLAPCRISLRNKSAGSHHGAQPGETGRFGSKATSRRLAVPSFPASRLATFAP